VVVNYDWFARTAVVAVMENLLSWLEPEEFVVACARAPRSGVEMRSASGNMRVCDVLRPPATGRSSRLDQRIMSLYFGTPLPARALQRLARRYNCGAILGVYSDIHALVAARRASAMLRLPLALYLHDPIAEGTQGSRIHEYARKVQDRLFAEHHLIFSMSEGLAAMLQRKYRLETIPLPHCYNELPPEPSSSAPRQTGAKTALFSGSIYEINRPAVVRAAKTAIRAGYRVVCTSERAADILRSDGVGAASIDVRGAPSRGDYLALLRDHDVLFVALAWPDESRINRDSLATTFPTKIPEYLGAGRSILVHCPEDYFLSTFVSERQCGLLVSERSEARLVDGWSRLRDDADLALQLGRNGHKAVSYFDGRRIAGMFKQHVEELVARGGSVPSCSPASSD
jgi:hypothetical protein